MKEMILTSVNDGIKAIEFLKTPKAVDFMYNAAKMITDAFRNEKKVVIAGNGGSMCDALHFSEELTGYFRKKRKALPAMTISEIGHMTCVSNDEGYEFVFSRALEAYLYQGDIFISLTTSGNSKNLINAINVAKEKKAKTISFLGKTGGQMKNFSDLEIIVEGFKYSDRIQEAHMTMIHIIIEIIEKMLFSPEEMIKKVQSTNQVAAV